jgi:hypothetical protein
MSRFRFIAHAAAACLVAALASSGATAEMSASVAAPQEHRRGPEQTFLTVPEWFLVHSPAEYAEFIKSRPPSEFPYFGHIGQFWQTYDAVYDATKHDYPFNAGYHVMVMVIGTSTTVEYGLKAGYETLIGRLTELARTEGMTEEDVFASRVAQDYVDFVRVIPWYEYDFGLRLRELWETSLWGPDPIRKWERKYALTTEYAAKAAYGWVIRKLTKLSYDEPLPVTAVLLDRLPPTPHAEVPELEVLDRLPDGSVLATVPRYYPFTHYATALARDGATFLEIAGNRGEIVVSALVPAAWGPGDSGWRIFLTQPILTQPETKRIVLTVPVRALGETLNRLSQPPARIEHVYDY